MSNCLFCVSPCPAKFAIVGGAVKKVKTEKCAGQDNSLRFPGDSTIAEQLRVVFILRNILKVGEEQLVEFLGSCGQLHPEYWISVCLSCGKTVKKYYETLREIGKLEKRLGGFSEELKGHIRRTKEVEGDGPTGMLWETIRSKVIDEPGNLFEEECDIESKPVIIATQSLAPPQESKTGPPSNLDPDSDWEPEELEQKPDESDDEYAPKRGSSFLRGNKRGPQIKKPIDKNIVRFVESFNPLYTAFYRGTTKHLACRQCPATDTYPSMMEAHLKLHEEGSGAVPCPLCGWYCLPNRMNYHYGKRHPLTQGRRSGNGKVYSEKKYHFQCPDCSALLTSIGKYREHANLHKNGKGEVCQKCNWLCKRMANHLAYWHTPNRKIPQREIKLMGKHGNYQPRNLKMRGKPESNQVERVKVKTEVFNDPLESMNAEWNGGFVEESNMSVPTSSLSEHRSSLLLDSEDDDSRQDTTTADAEPPQKRNKVTRKGVRDLDTSHPNYTKYYRGSTRYYGCRLCPAEDSYLKLLKAHLNLHLPDSGAIPCPEKECGWVVMPDKLTYHRGKRHRPKDAEKAPPPQNLYYFKCPDCTALLCSVSKYREHEQMHEKGEGIICTEEGCRWLIKEMGRHNLRWHPTDKSCRKGQIMHPRKIKLMEKR